LSGSPFFKQFIFCHCNQCLPFLIQILRNLTYEEQKYLYEQLGEMFHERQLGQN
jgi:hypothetical protein